MRSILRALVHLLHWLATEVSTLIWFVAFCVVGINLCLLLADVSLYASVPCILGYIGFSLWLCFCVQAGLRRAKKACLGPPAEEDQHAEFLCWNCGYCLVGNVNGICPECGKFVPSEQQEKLVTRDAVSGTESVNE